MSIARQFQAHSNAAHTVPKPAPKAAAAIDLPDLHQPKGKGGRPKKDGAKQHVSLRLSPDVLAYYRSFGDGWQSKVDEALRKAAGL